LIYAGFQAMQMFHVKAKIFELRMQKRETCTTARPEADAAGAKVSYDASTQAVR
jgi:hypothetical protein